MPCDQHRHQVVPQLGVAEVRPARVHQEAEQGGVGHAGVVPGRQGLRVVLAAGGPGALDQAVQAGVEQLQVGTEGALPGDEGGGQGQVPVRDVERGPVLRLLQHAVHGLDDGRVHRIARRPEIVVEDAQADDVQAERQEDLFHVDRRRGWPARPRIPVRHGVQALHRPPRALGKHDGHGVQVGGVEGGDDCPAPGLPCLEVGRDEALAHDGLQDLGQDALVVIEGIVFQQVARDDGVGDDDEGLGAKGQLEDAPIFDEPPVQGFEQGLVARQVGQLARSGRDVGAAQVGLEVALTDGCEVDGERERERERVSLVRVGDW